MRTTLTLDEDVAAQLARTMRESGKGLKQTLNETLRAGFVQRRQPARIEPFVVCARPLGLVPGLDYSNAGELLEVAEGPDRR